MYSKNKTDLVELGYTVIDDFLPTDVAQKIHSLFVNETNWELKHQVRDHHYEHVFKTESPFLPKGDESYSTRFNRSFNLEQNEDNKNLYNDSFV